jgi:hypothetical protein
MYTNPQQKKDQDPPQAALPAHLSTYTLLGANQALTTAKLASLDDHVADDSLVKNVQVNGVYAPSKDYAEADTKGSGANVAGKNGAKLAGGKRKGYVMRAFALNKPEYPWITVGTIGAIVNGATFPLAALLMVLMINGFFMCLTGLPALIPNASPLFSYYSSMEECRADCYVDLQGK